MYAAVKNCSLCGRIYQYTLGENICPECKKKREELFVSIKDYIGKQGGTVPMAQVAEEFDIPVKLLKQWVREERLVFAEGAIELECEQCGVLILSGRLCDVCKTKLAIESGYTSEISRRRALAEAPKQIVKEREKAKMRFLNS